MLYELTAFNSLFSNPPEYMLSPSQILNERLFPKAPRVGWGGGCMFLRTFENNREIQNHVYGNLYQVIKFFPLLDVYSSFYLQNISHFTPVSSIRISLPFFYLLISYLRNEACRSLNLSNNPTRSVCGGGGGVGRKHSV